MTELPEREDFGDYGQWPGRAVLDPSGRRLGDVREIYLDDATDRPEWVLVELGDDGQRFVPLAGATVDGEAIRVTQASERIEAAPSLDVHTELTQAEERRLYDHYGPAVAATPPAGEEPAPPRPVAPVAPPPPAPLQPATGPPSSLRGRPAVVAGIAASIAAIVFIVLRRRG